MSWSIWLVPSSVWVGEVWSKHGLKWMQEWAFTCWRPISPLWFFRNSAIGCKWEKLAPFIFYYYYYFYLFIYFYGLDPTMILRINIPKINRLIQYLYDFCSKSFTFSMRYSSNELIQKTVLTRGTNSCNSSLNCLLPGVTTKWITSTVEDLSSSLFQSAKRNNGGYRTRAWSLNWRETFKLSSSQERVDQYWDSKVRLLCQTGEINSFCLSAVFLFVIVKSSS